MLTILYFQLATLLNFFSNTYIIFLLFIFGYLEIVSEGFVVLSLITIFTHGLSSNIRNIYLGSSEILNLKKTILLRILIGIIGGSLTVLLTYIFIEKFHILFYSSLIFLTVINWILELPIARYEKSNTINFYYIINIIFFLLGSLFLIIFKNISYLTTFLFCYSLLNILIFRNFFIGLFHQRLRYKINLFNIGYFSTLLKTMTNFSWRYFIIFFIGKTDASFLFIGFICGSFFGTLFDISYGATFLKKIKNKNLFIIILFVIYIFIILLSMYFMQILQRFDSQQFNILLTSAVFSMCGIYFTVLGLRQRQTFFEKKELWNICYKADICIYCFNFLIIPVLYYLNQQYLTTSYFFSSLFLYFIYIIVFRYVRSNKII
jgi:hypothetical protein